jgi:adenylyl-sulfate kinase
MAIQPFIESHAVTNAGFTVWLTGLSGSGKSTLVRSVCQELRTRSRRAEILDADCLRKTICSDLGFSRDDRIENLRRIAAVSRMLAANGMIVLVAAISPYRQTRFEIRQSLGRFIEVHLSAPLDVCERRDTKGLYKMARQGDIHGFTGIDDPYEEPLEPNLRCATHLESVKESTVTILSLIEDYFNEIVVPCLYGF